VRTRHKPPALVSMWMLDVFCCALGCVTLLFLLNSRMATDAEKAGRAALRDLAASDQKLAAALTQLESTRARLTAEEAERGRVAARVTELEGLRLRLVGEAQDLTDQLKLARTEKDETGRKLVLARDEAAAAQAKLAAAEKKLDATGKELTAARVQAADAADALRKRQKELDGLARKESTGAAQIELLQKLMRDKDVERASLEARAAAARKELTNLEAKLRATQRDLDASLAAAKTAAQAAGEELTAAKAQIKDLTKKVDDANVNIIDLQGEKAKLADTYSKLQQETEARFAGIAMTGASVVFLVDMSGSMGKRDLNTVDATKWPLVIETACKVMRSMPKLKRYQVIVFSSGADWVFGAGEWQTYDGEKSVEAVRSALLKVKPKDDTNVYAALEKAFTLRPHGLDTVYLFSDGLPTSGPGLTAAQQAANLSEAELGAILGRHVREKLVRDWNRPLDGQRVKINSVGFYFDSPDVGAFLWALSRDNDGSFVGMSKP
jgi:hypothetical protein